MLEKLNRRNWVDTDVVPGYKERVYATEVAKDGSIIIPSYTIGDANYEYIIPYIALAIVYLVLVIIITYCIKLLERRE